MRLVVPVHPRIYTRLFVTSHLMGAEAFGKLILGQRPMKPQSLRPSFGACRRETMAPLRHTLAHEKGSLRCYGNDQCSQQQSHSSPKKPLYILLWQFPSGPASFAHCRKQLGRQHGHNGPLAPTGRHAEWNVARGLDGQTTTTCSLLIHTPLEIVPVHQVPQEEQDRCNRVDTRHDDSHDQRQHQRTHCPRIPVAPSKWPRGVRLGLFFVRHSAPSL
mmetsp:Transcript_19597/g.45580  ORF Transcript_19597/g.45580 Transcript_19597/m.45580 type:complete len:217 (+) Transcript_19597:168-818(+)